MDALTEEREREREKEDANYLHKLSITFVIVSTE